MIHACRQTEEGKRRIVCTQQQKEGGNSNGKVIMEIISLWFSFYIYFQDPQSSSFLKRER